MNEADMVKVRNSARAIGLILRKDKNEMDRTVKLDPTDRIFLERARMGAVELLATGKEKLEKRLKLAVSEYQHSLETDFDVQLEMIGSDGKPTTPVDANGKVIPTQREWPADCPEGIHGDDGEQLELQEEPEEPSAASPIPEGFALPGGVPPHIETGLVEALRLKKTRAAAIEFVAKNTDLTPEALGAHFDELIQRGRFLQKGRSVSIVEEPTPDPDHEALERARSAIRALVGEFVYAENAGDDIVAKASLQASVTEEIAKRAFNAMVDARQLIIVDSAWDLPEAVAS